MILGELIELIILRTGSGPVLIQTEKNSAMNQSEHVVLLRAGHFKPPKELARKLEQKQIF